MSTWTWPSLDKHPPLSAETVLALLPMIGTGHGWRSKRDIVSYVGSFVGGCYAGGPEVGEWLDLNPARTRVLLAELAADRVILRDDGGGGRCFWVELHPNVTGWRRVPWKVSDFELRRRLSDHAVQVVDLDSLECAIDAAKTRLIARPMGARCALANARLLTARYERQQVLSSRAPGTRDPGGGGGESSRGYWGARSGGGGARGHRRAMSRGAAPVVVPLLGFSDDVDGRDPPSAGADGAVGDSTIESSPGAVTVEQFEEARALFVRRLRLRFLEGGPKKLLRRRLRVDNLDRYRQLVAHIPSGLGAKWAMEWIADRLDDPAWTPAQARADERQHLEQRADELRGQLTMCAYDDAGRAELEAELYRCVDALSELPFEEAL